MMAKWPCAVQGASPTPPCTLLQWSLLFPIYSITLAPLTLLVARSYIYIYIFKIVHLLVGLQADLNSRLSAFRFWLLLFLWRGVRGGAAGWDGVSTISNLMRGFFVVARVCTQRRVVRCRVAARPLQFCWWPLADPLLVLRLRRVPVLLGSHEVPLRRMLPGHEPLWFMHVRNNISANVRLYVKISSWYFNCSLWKGTKPKYTCFIFWCVSFSMLKHWGKFDMAWHFEKVWILIVLMMMTPYNGTWGDYLVNFVFLLTRITL